MEQAFTDWFKANATRFAHAQFSDESIAYSAWLEGRKSANNKPPKVEYILCAAIDYNGVIVCGHRHGDCYETLKALIGEIDADKLPDRNKQGFLTSENRYVGREEAWTIAKENNQIVYGLEASDHDDDILLKGLHFDEKQKSILISENLY